MSLVRWGQDGSGVYVYNVDEKIECCCPSLNPSFRCDTDVEMIEHLQEHKKAGIHIPDWVFDVLNRKETKFLYDNRP